MATYNNQAPTAVNNVGLYGATDESIGAYKQASEYAADARYWALLAESKFGTVDDLIAEVERLFQQGILMRADIEQLKQDFENQDARLMVLVAEANAAASNAQNAVDIVNQKLIEIQAQLDLLLAMKVTVETLPPGSEATGSFNNQTGEIHLGIPEGEKGAAGSVTNLSTAPTGTPEIGDIGFYVDKDDNTVHKASLESIANLIPSVRSIKVNDGVAETGDVVLTLTKDTVGLGNVLNLPQYSRQEVNNKVDNFIKVYGTKEEADADAANRQVGETVLVWNSVKYDFYEVASNKTLTPSKSEPRIVTVNGVGPNEATGNLVLSPTSIGAAKSGANSDITELNALTKPITPEQGGTGTTDLGQARIAFNVQSFHSGANIGTGAYSHMSSPDYTKELRLANDGGFRVVDGNTSSTVPFSIGAGGTGATSALGARDNLGLNRIIQSTQETSIASGNGTYRLTVQNGGNWGNYNNNSQSWQALGVGQGGTGATSQEAARVNLGVDSILSYGPATSMRAPQKGKAVLVDDSGIWGGYDEASGNYIPLGVGQGGTGGITVPVAQKNLQVMESNNTSLQLDVPNLRPGLYYVGDNTNVGGSGKPFNYAQVLTLSENDGTSGNWTQLAFSTLTNSAPKIRRRNSTPALLSNWSDFAVVGLNVTVDGNGFLKASSPIVNLKGSGEIETNEQADGAKAEKIGVGVYKISGVLGLNSDTIWGGVDGGFEIPLDRNKQPRIWLDYEVESDGTILVKTFHRTHPNSPVFARNEIEGFTDGDPIDIPSDTFISIRVEMPETK